MEKTVKIDWKELDSMKDAHRIFRETLQFPDYYGNNLDALYDMLSSMGEAVTVEVTSDPDQPRKGCQLLRVLKDLAEEKKNFTLIENN